MKTILMAAALLCAMETIAQKKDIKQDSLPAVSKADSAKATAVKPYDKVINSKAITRKGLFIVHNIDDNYYLEIPDSILHREILMVSRIARSPVYGVAVGGYYAGDEIDERVIEFEKGPANKIFMRGISYFVHSSDSSGNGMYRSLSNSSVQPILAAFPVKAYNEKDSATVIDVTDIINNDNGIFAVSILYKTVLKVGSLQRDRSYIQSIKTFSQNVEIKTVKTYTSTNDPTGQPVTFELNNSLVLLPKVPMKPRFADDRVGYLGTGYLDFDANSQGVKRTEMITRWRLEPKPEDLENYKRGELVEPQKPIVIYIDPATPKKWVPYLIQGVNDWQAAFEKAGFKNAIMAKEAPDNDSTWSLDDATHSAIVYKPSDIANASGPHVHDPRSGEILETHINWYHNVMSLVHNWYMIQAGAVDPRARKMEFDDQLMGQLIRFVSSHEVGHALGLMHNFGSSSTVPVDSLRNKNWLEAHGHTPSIMDYARFNYVAQPEDGITEKGIFPRIGDYDKWAIEWGYKLFPGITNEKEERTFLNKWIIDSLSKNHRLWYGPQLYGAPDPRSQNEDLGDDAVKAGTYGIKNLKRIILQLPDWTSMPAEGYENLQIMFKALLVQYRLYMSHVVANIGGVYTTCKTVEEKGVLYEPVSKARQKEAMTFLNEQVFQTPQWLFNKEIMAKISSASAEVTGVGIDILTGLLNRTGKLQDNIRRFGEAGKYPIYEFFNDIKKSVWSELATGATIGAYRRDLQSAYVTSFIEMIKMPANKPVGSTQVEMIAIARAHLKALQQEIKAAILPEKDPVSKAHLQFSSQRIEDALHPKNN
ncbi:hypothetical protein A3860_21725 [Niastella vici]|uniref:Zinc-dependent metalloprotease n=1 Tax=Niastella vici TaxID=1703345 RepID=A0A1V9G095_9BACT|nr:zinc-dependent metalloprotease [Niastella vici]OQP64039.1 hypothetical protein A3860_21725 [Niastella vici]